MIFPFKKPFAIAGFDDHAEDCSTHSTLQWGVDNSEPYPFSHPKLPFNGEDITLSSYLEI